MALLNPHLNLQHSTQNPLDAMNELDAPPVLKHPKRVILFAEDWSYFPTAFPDFETKNQSFVRQAAVYKKMGIKNHAFLLALVNPALKGVDPHDPNLTFEQMMAIGYECSINPWYFFREVARAPATSGEGSVPMEANRGNIALFWSFFNHVTIILIQIRQTGKSFSTDVLMTYLLNIYCRSTSINLLTKDDGLRRANIQRLKDIVAEIPSYLRQGTKADVNNGEEISIGRMKNIYRTHVPQASAKRALNAGRGLTSPIFHIDEGPFQPNIAISLPAALAATGAANDAARARGEPHGVILTTTAGKKDDKDGKFIYDMVSEAAVWDERSFFDAKNEEELYQLIRRSSPGKKVMVNATFSHRQLGKTDQWLMQKLEESHQTGDDANRDYFNMWTSGSNTSPLSPDVAGKINRSIDDPCFTHVSQPYQYITRWYVPEDEIARRLDTGKFVLGMDTSEASGGDDISFVLTDSETLDTIAVGYFNDTNLWNFTEWTAKFLIQFKNVTAIIERRSTGAMVIDGLLLLLPQAGEDPFKRLWNRVVNDHLEFPDRLKEVRATPLQRRDEAFYTRYKNWFGFSTSGGNGLTSRNGLYTTTLQMAAVRAGTKVKDEKLAKQILGLVIRNGRVDHEVGKHDDLVIGWLLCHWLLTQATNLQYYGFDLIKIMSDVTDKSSMTEEEIEFRQEQKELRDKMAVLCDMLAAERDESISIRLEHEIRRLDQKIIQEQGETYSLDNMIEKVQEARRSRMRRWHGTTNSGDQGYFGYADNSQTTQVQSMMSDLPPGWEGYRN